LADFGLSGEIAGVSINTKKMFGVIPYMDPKSFCDNQNYKLNKQSDIYSVGVLMWQISSGRQPFYAKNADYVRLTLAIINGKREEIIYGTPNEYSCLYKGNFNNIYRIFFFKKKHIN